MSQIEINPIKKRFQFSEIGFQGYRRFFGVLKYSEMGKGILALYGPTLSVEEKPEMMMAEVYRISPIKVGKLTKYVTLDYEWFQQRLGKKMVIQISREESKFFREIADILVWEKENSLPKRYTFYPKDRSGLTRR